MVERRRFLKTALLGAGAGLLPLGGGAWALRTEVAAPRRLVVVMLRGAVDGLNVVVPYGDPQYRSARPTIALTGPGDAAGVIDLDGHFGLHPALRPLLPLWQGRRLAFVHASGSSDPSRSHFDAQRNLESGTPGNLATQDGWMNRLVATLPGSHAPTEAISLGPTQPRILMGRAPTSNLTLGPRAAAPLPVDRAAVADAFAAIYDGGDAMSAAFRDGELARKELLGDMPPDEQTKADNGAPGPEGFPQVAGRLAGLLRQDPRIRLAFVDLGGWDTHVNQGNATGQLANHLAPLGEGLATLAQRLGPQLDDTVVIVMSEFGRTVHENGNGGTDHGHGNVMWLLGGGVGGGKVHGRWPGLEAAALYQARDLAVTSDFRDVIGLVLERHFRISDKALGHVFPGSPARDPALHGLIRA